MQEQMGNVCGEIKIPQEKNPESKSTTAEMKNAFDGLLVDWTWLTDANPAMEECEVTI